MSTGARGANRERQVRKLLEEQGWWVSRASGSFGDADLIALKAGRTPRLIEVKANKGSPWMNFRKVSRNELAAAATKAGAVAQLCHWPPHGVIRWYDDSKWPD